MKEKRKEFFKMIDEARRRNRKVDQNTLLQEIEEAVEFAKKIKR